MRTQRLHAAGLALLAALILWTVIFVLRPFNFWLMMSLSTAALAGASFIWGEPVSSIREWNLRHLLLGAAAAAALYAIFRGGHFLLQLVEQWLPRRAEYINAVYADRGVLPAALVGALLFFPIGFGEEIFWRGWIQKTLAGHLGGGRSYAITAVLYTAVHLPTGNPVLILAALVCGLFWGAVYWKTGSAVPATVSHMIWDPLIFVIWPLA